MRVCACVRAYVCMYVCTYVHAYVRAGERVCVCGRALYSRNYGYVCIMYVCVRACVRVCIGMYVCMYVWTKLPSSYVCT